MAWLITRGSGYRSQAKESDASLARYLIFVKMKFSVSVTKLQYVLVNTYDCSYKPKSLSGSGPVLAKDWGGIGGMCWV